MTQPEDQSEALPRFGLHSTTPKVETRNIKDMSQEELLVLHTEIEGRLQGIKLKDVNLIKETMIQLQKAKALQADAAMQEKSTPVNQRAQVQNSIAGILRSLTTIQAELHDSESLKRLKSSLVAILKSLPDYLQEKTFAAIKAEIDRLGQEVDV